jgi:hypothetical protein
MSKQEILPQETFPFRMESVLSYGGGVHKWENEIPYDEFYDLAWRSLYNLSNNADNKRYRYDPELDQQMSIEVFPFEFYAQFFPYETGELGLKIEDVCRSYNPLAESEFLLRFASVQASGLVSYTYKWAVLCLTRLTPNGKENEWRFAKFKEGSEEGFDEITIPTQLQVNHSGGLEGRNIFFAARTEVWPLPAYDLEKYEALGKLNHLLSSWEDDPGPIEIGLKSHDPCRGLFRQTAARIMSARTSLVKSLGFNVNTYFAKKPLPTPRESK